MPRIRSEVARSVREAQVSDRISAQHATIPAGATVAQQVSARYTEDQPDRQYDDQIGEREEDLALKLSDVC